MASEPTDVLLGAMILVLAIASIGTWFYLADRLRHGPILPYEPRRPVPWHGIWLLVPVLLVVLTIIAALQGDDPAADAKSASATDLVERLALGSVQQTAFVVAMMAVMIAVSRATRADLGLPKDRGELVRDVRIGFVAWLAALVPVYLVQFVLISVLGGATGHPLIKMVEEHASPTLFALAFVAAVVVAPICEELMFRMLLQGWLEKWEDMRLGWRTPPAVLAEEAASVELEAPIAAEEIPLDPPRIGVGGMPYGWLPIGISALLFALAHVGYGPDPIPLFLLALILGYVYQRTHRIVPSMVTHALFNSMSLFALWRFISAGAH